MIKIDKDYSFDTLFFFNAQLLGLINGVEKTSCYSLFIINCYDFSFSGHNLKLI